MKEWKATGWKECGVFLKALLLSCSLHGAYFNLSYAHSCPPHLQWWEADISICACEGALIPDNCAPLSTISVALLLVWYNRPPSLVLEIVLISPSVGAGVANIRGTEWSWQNHMGHDDRHIWNRPPAVKWINMAGQTWMSHAGREGPEPARHHE